MQEKELDTPNYIESFQFIKESLSYFVDGIRKIYKTIEENRETIVAALQVIGVYAEWCSVIDKLAKSQIVFTDNLSFELAGKFDKEENIEKAVEEYYFDNDNEKINNLITRCQNAEIMIPHGGLFYQVLCAYRSEHYQLACIGLFTILDDTLSKISGKPKVTNFKNQIEIIEKRINDNNEISEIDRKFICICTAIKPDDLKNSIFMNSDFSATEPETLNRHWLLHGRTRRTYTRMDFLKVLLWIDAVIYLQDICADTQNCKEGEI